MKKTFKNQTIYIRETWSEEHPFTIISNYIVKDDRLSATEKGLMLMILSNHREYIFNSTVLHWQSGLGKVEFNKSMKILQKLGYLIKKPLKSGGYKWIVIESTLIYEDLIKIGYIKYDVENSNWIINEKLESSLQLTDFHRKSVNQNPTNRNPIYEIPDSRNPESKPIINNNTTNKEIGSIKNEEINNRENNNGTPDSEISNLDIFAELEKVETESKSHPQNSVPILFVHSESLQSVLRDGRFTVNDFKDYSDSYIAHIVLSCTLQSDYPEWKDSYENLKYNRKHYGVLTYACRSALQMNFETTLKKELLLQSNLPEREIYKRLFGYYPD
jgi:hypothetical protein